MTMSMELHDPAEVGMSATALARGAALMDEHHAAGKAVMAGAVVARHGKVVFTHTVGDARPGGPPLTLDAVFPIASEGKPMTAAVILALAERGQVGIFEPVSATLSELEPAHDLLVHHLLTHTSGWNEDDQAAAIVANLEEALATVPPDRDPLTHVLFWCGRDVPRRTEPGELMQYCSYNYSVLGEIVRRVTGGTLHAAMHHYLFEPIGMTSSATIVGPDLEDLVIERPPGVPYGPDHPSTSISFNDPVWAASDDGGSGVYTSLCDMVRFRQMILDGGTVGGTRVLSADAVRVMVTDQIPGAPADSLGRVRRAASWGYGYGLTGYERWPRYGGGTSRPGTLRHGGAGGAGGWTDPTSGVVAAYFEVVTDVNEFGVQTTWVGHRFEDVVNAAVLD